MKPFLKQYCKHYKSFPVQSTYGQKHCLVKQELVRKKIFAHAIRFSVLISNFHHEHCSPLVLSISEKVANECI